jgi:hypothetical protein
MESIRELADEIYRERVMRARATPPDEKLVAGPQIFERVCRIMIDGIRHQFPDADENRVSEILRQRLALSRRLESRT